MRQSWFYRVCFALWLGIIALAANAFEQQQLAIDVLAAATAEIALVQGGSLPAGFHVMADGTIMAGPMGGNAHDSNSAKSADGHTHKGYADCTVCGAVAELAAFTLPVLPVVALPRAEFARFPLAALTAQVGAAADPPYASRAPPLLMS